MKQALLCNGMVLVVGDGDFSFSVSLVKLNIISPNQIFTSNLESEDSIKRHVQAAENMNSLKQLGVSVLLDTDARYLHNHPVISAEKFDRIVFNFPLADRHNIKKNRALIADFFLSCRSVLTPDGQVLVTLCKGQGGTPADQPVRSWHDSWQVVAMATNASFLLRQAIPFDPSQFLEYHSVGFRFQDKSFNVSGGITHIFEQGSPVEEHDDGIRGVVYWEGERYSCSRYVAEHFERNLLKEEGNPVNLLGGLIEKELHSQTCLQVQEKPVCFQFDSSPIIPSHKSSAYLQPFENEADDGAGQVDESSSGETTAVYQSHNVGESSVGLSTDKDWKNSENLKRMQKSQLSHGVASHTTGVTVTADIISNSPGIHALLPRNRENVYILVKKDNSGSEGRRLSSSVQCGKTSGNDAADDVGCSIDPGVNQMETDDVCIGANSISSIYHHRVSLLENLSQLCSALDNNNSATNDAPYTNSTTTTVDFNYATQLADADRLLTMNRSTNTNTQNSYSCIYTFGLNLLPCPITPETSPVQHQMMIVHKLACCIGQDASSSGNYQQYLNPFTSDILSLIKNVATKAGSAVNVPLLDISLTKSSCSTSSICIDGMVETEVIGNLQICPSPNVHLNATSPLNENYSTSKSFGMLLQCRRNESVYHVTLIDLQQLVCSLCFIDNWRILWSRSDKFINQFRSNDSYRLCKYEPFSVYPMKFVHDLSFWEQDGEGGVVIKEEFDEFTLYDTIRNVCGHLVHNVLLIDVYEEPEEKRRSRCYRLHFNSPDRCLSYSTSWKIQSKIRMEVARSLGVKLR